MQNLIRKLTENNYSIQNQDIYHFMNKCSICPVGHINIRNILSIYLYKLLEELIFKWNYIIPYL